MAATSASNPSNPSKNENRLILRRNIVGSRRLSNYVWAIVSTMGGVGFLLASLSSLLQVNLLPFSDPTQLIFIPQGVAMGFYGVAGSLLGLYLWLVISWDVGGGYNEFNRETGKAKIFRYGFPGKNRKIEIEYPLEELQAVRVDLKEGLNPKRALYLRVKGRGDLPLTRVGQPLPLAELENQGAELARFLSIPLEGL
ncbi:MAG: photosystem I assembly protein Ycf4 [Oculatellaceae cyanobacterium Prado106]|nr:photosystem I assembly protein Ycf4 [Oculatellaceae cyanobacterium Prado106]